MNGQMILEFAKTILEIPSPTGYTRDVIAFMEKKVKELGYKTSLTNKGNLEIYVEGKSEHTKGLCAHVDTLGLMVRSIRDDGTLNFTLVGSPLSPTLDGEYCLIKTRGNKTYTGTILSDSSSKHVYKDSTSLERTEEHMHIVLDEKVSSKKEAEALGIMTGDYICFDPKTTITENGFIKSRFLDDKLSVAILYNLLKDFKEEGIVPKDNWIITISTYEEVGHGSSYINPAIEELIAVDMGCIGKDLNCSEYDVSICAKDSSGPYDYALISDFVDICKNENINFAIDIYPYYGSDVSAALRAGANIRGGLIGPGVANSHGMERSHMDAVMNTFSLLKHYMA